MDESGTKLLLHIDNRETEGKLGLQFLALRIDHSELERSCACQNTLRIFMKSFSNNKDSGFNFHYLATLFLNYICYLFLVSYTKNAGCFFGVLFVCNIQAREIEVSCHARHVKRENESC